MTIPLADAFALNGTGNFIFNGSGISGYSQNITGDFSNISWSDSFVQLNNSLTTNSSTDLSLYDIQTNSAYTLTNLTAIQISGSMNVSAKMNLSNHNYTVQRDGVNYASNMSDASGWVNFTYSDWAVFVHSFSIIQDLNLTYPINGSSLSSNIVNLMWIEGNPQTPFTYLIATDGQFINNVSTGSGSCDSNGICRSGNINLNYNTQYFWRVTDNLGIVSTVNNFTISAVPVTPGGFNISVWDEQNTSLQILNYTIQLYNSTSFLTKTSNSTTGWTNFSGAEVISGEYLVIAIPGSGYTNYYQRMTLQTSPANVTMYLPNSTSNTIDIVSFSLMDVTGRFPYTNSTISIYKGGLLMESSYFSADATHAVYLIQGQNYQITIQNGNNIENFGNYVPTGSGTSTITINNFNINTSAMIPITYNITYSPTNVTLEWNDAGGVMTSLNFTVYRNISSPTQICQLITMVDSGQSICVIDNTTTYNAVLSILMTDGSYKNISVPIDYTYGTTPSQIGTNPVDGSPMGTGMQFNYGTWTTPQWAKNLVSLFLFILLIAEFGAYYSGIGSIISIIILLVFEYYGWFVPAGSSGQTAVMALTGAIGILAVIYFLQHKDTFRLGG